MDRHEERGNGEGRHLDASGDPGVARLESPGYKEDMALKVVAGGASR